MRRSRRQILRRSCLRDAADPEPLDDPHPGLALDSGIDFKVVESDYLSLDQVVLFLTAGSPVFDYQGGIYGIMEDGQLMGTIDDGRRVKFPLAENAKELLGGVDAVPLDSLRVG